MVDSVMSGFCMQANMKKVVANAYKQYAKSRPNPSTESVKRVKVMDQNALGYHPLFGGCTAIKHYCKICPRSFCM
jgi:hypothetical protein